MHDLPRVLVVEGKSGPALAAFRADVAKLGANAKFHLRVEAPLHSVIVLDRILKDASVCSRIAAFSWEYTEAADVSQIAKFLAKSCPNIVSLSLLFAQVSAMDFASTLLPSLRNIQHVCVAGHAEGDAQKFFAALSHSSVRSFAVGDNPSEHMHAMLYRFLMDSRLLSTWFSGGIASVAMNHRIYYSDLEDVGLIGYTLTNDAANARIAGGVKNLTLLQCTIANGFRWQTFLAKSKVRNLVFKRTVGSHADWHGLGILLKSHRLDHLTMANCSFASELTFTKVVRFTHVGPTDDATLQKLADALRSEYNLLREISIQYSPGIKTILMPAWQDRRCRLWRLVIHARTDDDLPHIGALLKTFEDHRMLKAINDAAIRGLDDTDD